MSPEFLAVRTVTNLKLLFVSVRNDSNGQKKETGAMATRLTNKKSADCIRAFRAPWKRVADHLDAPALDKGHMAEKADVLATPRRPGMYAGKVVCDAGMNHAACWVALPDVASADLIYAQSTSGRSHSGLTAPSDSALMRKHNPSLRRCFEEHAFLRYPTEVPQRLAKSSRSAGCKPLRYESNLSISELYHLVMWNAILFGVLRSGNNNPQSKS